MKKLIFALVIVLSLILASVYYLNIYIKIDKTDQLYMMFVDQDNIDEEKIELIEYNHLKDESMLKIDRLKKLNVFVDYDRDEDIVSLSDGQTLIKYYFGKSELKINDELISQDKAVFIKESEGVYVNFEFVKPYFKIQKVIGEDRKNILLRNEYKNYSVSSINKSSIIFNKDSIISDNRDTDIINVYKSSGSEEYITGDSGENYTEVITPNLIYGLVRKGNVENLKVVKKEETKLTKDLDKKINLTWEYAANGNPNTDDIGYMQGLNVISPIWYALKDTEGNLKSTYGASYYKWAKVRGYNVWPVVKNDFTNLDKTSAFIKSSSARENLINRLVADSIANGYDGINVDFENMYLEDKYYFSVFISELATMLRQNNILLSVDVTVMDGSDNWSKSIDRAEIGRVIDYLVIMTYDEYWASSPISGSVASYNWADRNIKKITDIVPSEKVVLGLPFYMRVWTETPSKTVANKMNVNSKVLTMKYAKAYIEENELDLIWDENAKQYYSIYIIDGSLNKIWFEDNKSIESKIDIVHKYNLAGVASWRRGFEEESIWPTIDSALNE
ncbi:MAG: glycosyl hydrolase family 18 protein [Acidaminobacteraceae bacterium]